MSVKNDIREHVAKRIARLSHMSEAGCAKGELAKLRTGAGKAPNASVKSMSLVIQALPEEFLGRNGMASKEEWAIHTALTLYAWHQQGHSKNISICGQTLGKALRKAYSDLPHTEMDEAFSLKLHELSRIQDIQLLAVKLRSIAGWLSSKEIGLDYASLASDIYEWQFPESRGNVFLRWTQEYRKIGNSDSKNKKIKEKNL